jgi:hypothetical protein
MDFDLKQKDDMIKESLIVTYTNTEMHFKVLSKKYDSNLIPESMNTNIDELNAVIKDLNKKSYRVMNDFRLKENEDFMATPLFWMARLFPFIVISCVVIDILVTLRHEKAR